MSENNYLQALENTRYQELTFTEWEKLHDSLPRAELGIALERAGSLLKYIRFLMDQWLEKHVIIKDLGLQLIVMPDDMGMITFIDGYVPKQIIFTARVCVEGHYYMNRTVIPAYYLEDFDRKIKFDIESLVHGIFLDVPEI